MTQTMTLQFANRGRRLDTLAARRTVWPTKCGQYRIEKSEIAGMPTVWRACVQIGAGWTMLSRHRSRAAAVKACEQHNRRSRNE